MEGQTKNVKIATDSETTTVPATSHETQDAIDALLLLGKPTGKNHCQGLEDNKVLMPIGVPQQPNPGLLPDIPPENRPTKPAKTSRSST